MMQYMTLEINITEIGEVSYDYIRICNCGFNPNQYQQDEDRKNFRKIFVCGNVPHAQRDSPLRQQVVDASSRHS